MRSDTMRRNVLAVLALTAALTILASCASSPGPRDDAWSSRVMGPKGASAAMVAEVPDPEVGVSIPVPVLAPAPKEAAATPERPEPRPVMAAAAAPKALVQEDRVGFKVLGRNVRGLSSLAVDLRSRTGKAFGRADIESAIRAGTPAFDVALAWNALGLIRVQTGDYSSALEAYGYALDFIAQAGDRSDTGQRALMAPDRRSIERSERQRKTQEVPATLKQGPAGDAGPVLRRAQGSERELGEGIVRNNLAVLHRRLGAFARAEAEYRRARNLIDANLAAGEYEWRVLRSNLGLFYDQVGRFDDAGRFYREAVDQLDLSRPENLGMRARISMLQAGLLAAQDRLTEAVPLAEAAWNEAESVFGDRDPETVLALINLGWLDHLADRPMARHRLYSAWLLAQRHDDMELLMAADMAMSRALHDAGETSAAIWFARRATERLDRQVRRQESLAPDLRGVMRLNGDDAYRHLAQLYFSTGRTALADSVLQRLKEREYGRLTGGGLVAVRGGNASSAGSMRDALTGPDPDAVSRQPLDRTAATLGDIAREIETLQGRPDRTPAEERRLARLMRQFDDRQEEFQGYLSALARSPSEAGRRASQIQSDRAWADELQADGGKTLAIYTITEDRSLHFVLVSANYQERIVVKQRRAVLEDAVARFREALATRPEQRERNQDLLAAARALHALVFAPIAQQVEASGATTLIWSLDGALKSIPVSALHDGRAFLVERYALGQFNSASMFRLSPPSAGHAGKTGLGMGVVRSAAGKAPLTFVEDELVAVFRGRKYGGDGAKKPRGILQGEIYLDDYFTPAALRSVNRQPRSVVHLATHFRSSSGPATPSALLTGKGWWSLKEINREKGLFRGADLVTLAACSSAVEGAAGRGDGLGLHDSSLANVALFQGARSVVASLWEVNDAASARIMADFYRQRFELGANNADALRNSQLARIRAPSNPDTGGPSLADPYYWAPYVLIGAWRR